MTPKERAERVNAGLSYDGIPMVSCREMLETLTKEFMECEAEAYAKGLEDAASYLDSMPRRVRSDGTLEDPVWGRFMNGLADTIRALKPKRDQLPLQRAMLI